MKKGCSPLIEVRRSGIHGTGVYAVRDIRKGKDIAEYVGRKVAKEETVRIEERQLAKHREDPNNGAVYIFELNKKWDIDGDVPHNPAKFINHSCEPNAEAVNTSRRILIKALRDIRKGEEITYNYGYDSLDDYDTHPCRCGSPRCVGYILDEDLWPKLQEKKKSFK